MGTGTGIEKRQGTGDRDGELEQGREFEEDGDGEGRTGCRRCDGMMVTVIGNRKGYRNGSW
jgi:hypothetical protein